MTMYSSESERAARTVGVCGRARLTVSITAAIRARPAMMKAAGAIRAKVQASMPASICDGSGRRPGMNRVMKDVPKVM
jgi:hypothetical protein